MTEEEKPKKPSRSDKKFNADSYNDDTMSELLTAFTIIDKDHNGDITAAELGSMMKSLGQYATVQELEAMVDEGATTEIDHLDFPEFVSIMLRGLKTEFLDGEKLDEKIALAFEMFKAPDEQGAQFITVDSLMKILHNLEENHSREYIERLFKEANMSGDEKLSIDEFVKMMKTL